MAWKGRGQFFDRVPYPTQATQLARQANSLDRNVHRIPYGSDSRDLVGVNGLVPGGHIAYVHVRQRGSYV
jgi:hypothetical protein